MANKTKSAVKVKAIAKFSVEEVKIPEEFAVKTEMAPNNNCDD